MGSILSSSMSVSGAAASYYTYKYLNKELKSIEFEEVAYIEERCVDLNNFTNLLSGKHSFLLITTSTSRQVRYDYNTTSGEPVIKYDYWEIIPTSIFRKQLARPGLNVSQVTQIIKKHALKSDYSLLNHNCQHVSRDAYNEITGETEVILRNDFINTFMEAIPLNLRDEILRRQSLPEYTLQKMHRKLREYLSAAPNKQEALKQMKSYYSLDDLNKFHYYFENLRYMKDPDIDPEVKRALFEMFGETGIGRIQDFEDPGDDLSDLYPDS